MIEHVYSTRVPKAEWEEGVGEHAETHEPARWAHTAATLLQERVKVRSITQGCLQTSACVPAPT